MSERPVPDQTKILQSFRRSLNHYHDNAIIQAEIAKTLIKHFQASDAPEQFGHVLEFGCSTGLLTQQLISQFNIKQFTVNDLVEESQHFVTPILNEASCRWQFRAGAIETIDLPEKYDLIASTSTIQWIFDTPALLNKLTYSLAPGGWLMLSTFADTHFSELQMIGSKAQATHYINAADWPALIHDNLTIKFVRQEEKKVYFPTVRAMLSHLRQTGVNGNAGQIWSRQKLVQFESEYEAHFSDDNGVYLTYAPVYIIVRKHPIQNV